MPIPYSVEVPNAPLNEGEGRPRRHPQTAKGDFVTTFQEGINTLYDTFRNATTKYGTLAL